MNNKNSIDRVHDDVFNSIKVLIDKARNEVAREANNILVQTHWEIGRIIVEGEQGHSERAEYGRELLKDLSKRSTKEYGRGLSVSDLQFMRRFFQEYEIQQTVSVKLTWSHYCELLSTSDEKKKGFYEKESINANWSVKELKGQIKTSLLERLLLSPGEENKEKVLDLALKSNEINKPDDLVKNPYVSEFLGLPEEKPMMESDLEKALIDHTEKFLLELGRGFMYVGSQQRVTLGNIHYYVDMISYNKILRSCVLIELKTSKFMPEAVSQINIYLNYYKLEVNDETDNEPIGIILCTDKNGVQAEYALGSLSNKILVSKYTLYIPNMEELEEQVEKVIEKYEEK